MSETNYDVTKRELLAVIFALKAYRQYLLGRSFVIRTDHSALQWLRRTPEPMGQFARWLTFIEQYQFEVAQRLGTKHGNADGLSRRPDAHQVYEVLRGTLVMHRTIAGSNVTLPVECCRCAPQPV